MKRSLLNVVLGIDPGYAITGFAVVEGEKLIDCGVIRTFAKDSLPLRLKRLMKDLKSIVKSQRIKTCGIEKVYFHSNHKTVIEVAQARGVVLATLAEMGVSVSEYTPPQIKKAVTGSGRAEKQDVKIMVKRLFQLKNPILQDDACDAAAIAYCHTHALRYE